MGAAGEGEVGQVDLRLAGVDADNSSLMTCSEPF